jgi:hypothetical protein
MRKVLNLVARIGLTPEQKEVLKLLAEKHKSFFRVMGEMLSKDEDFAQANMMSPALGTEVLRRQVEAEKREEAEIQQLIDQCRKLGIAEWRVKLSR